MEAKKVMRRAPKWKSILQFWEPFGTKFHQNWTLELLSFVITFLKVWKRQSERNLLIFGENVKRLLYIFGKKMGTFSSLSPPYFFEVVKWHEIYYFSSISIAFHRSKTRISNIQIYDMVLVIDGCALSVTPMCSKSFIKAEN